MPSVLELFNTFAQRSGADVNSEEFKSFLSNPELSKIVVPEVVSNKMLSGLHSLGSAEAALSDTLRKKHHAESLNRIDENLYLHAKELGYDDALVDELKTAPKTDDRIKLFTSKIKELESKKVGTSGKERQDLVDKIDLLNGKISAITESHNKALSEAQGKYNSQITDFATLTKLASYKYANDKLSKDVNMTTAKILLENKIAELNGKKSFDEKTGKVLLSSQDGSVLYDAQQNKVDFDTLCDQVLAASNLIEVSGQNGNGQGQGQQQSVVTQGQNGGALPRGGSSFESALGSMVAAGQE
jgi:hypothetical protein